jgi:multimeric flavodoxin WrbA
MRILACVSSHRKNGNTAKVTNLIAEQLKRIARERGEALEIETINLARMDIQMCRGCRICFNKGENLCPLKDDFPAIKAKMQAADGVIVASPIYVDDVTGVMKNFIDRLAHVCHRPEFAGKYAYLVTTVGETRSGHALRTLDTAFRTWGYYIIGKANFITGAFMRRDDMEARYRGAIEQAAWQIFDAVHRQQFRNPPFLSLMVFKIQQVGWNQVDRGSLDYAYWSGKGWLDPEREYFIPHRAGRLKVAVARLAGSLLAKFMIQT